MHRALPYTLIHILIAAHPQVYRRSSLQPPPTFWLWAARRRVSRFWELFWCPSPLGAILRPVGPNWITTALRSNQRYRMGAYNQQNHHEHYFYRDQYLGTLHGIPKTISTFIVPWPWILFVCRYLRVYASMLQHPTAKKEDTGQTCEGSIECESGSGEWYAVLVTLKKLQATY